MKKKLFAISVIIICLSILASATAAFYTVEGVAHNVITSSGVNIAIEEWQQTEDGLEAYPGGAMPITPGMTVSKIPTVRNFQEKSFIRARVHIIIRNADGQIMDIAPEQLDKLIQLSMNESDWLAKSGEDTWLYYYAPVDTGDRTTGLFGDVRFSGVHMTNEYQNCTVEISVEAQAVQYANNEESVLDAKGWPESEEGGQQS